MGRITLSHFLNSSGTVTVPSSYTLELFEISTHTTASGSATTTLPVAIRDELKNGDLLYVGTANSGATVAISDATLPVAGAGNVTLGTAITFNNNDAIVVASRSGTKMYAPVYDDPDYATAILGPSNQTALSLDSDSETKFFVPEGRYGVRIANASNVTIELDHLVSFEEPRAVVRSQSVDMALAIEAEIARLPSGGGKIKIPAGTFDLDTNLGISTANVVLEGEGNSTIFRVTTNVQGISVTAADVVLRNFKILPTTANSSAGLIVGSAARLMCDSIVVDPNGLANTGNGIRYTTGPSMALVRCAIIGSSGSFASGIDLVSSPTGVVITGCQVDGCTIGIDLNDSASIAGVSIHGNRISNCTTGLYIGTGNTDYAYFANSYASNTTNVNDANTAAQRGFGFGDDSLADAFTVGGDVRVWGMLRLDTGTQLVTTIASGSLAATASYMALAAETGTTDTLNNITGGIRGDILIVYPDSGDTITVADAATGAGEIHLTGSANFAMSGDDMLMLVSNGTDWYEIGRGDNS